MLPSRDLPGSTREVFLLPALDRPAATSSLRVDLHLEQSCLGGERVLALLRTRGYRLRRLELEAPSRCRLEITVQPDEVPLLLARLERIPGVRVEACP
jgi:acetolactate synthase regulatory subunit